jgi:hypothetical protein
MKWMTLVVVVGLTAALVGCSGQSGTVTGPGGKKLTLKTPTDTTLKQGDTRYVTVSITKTKFDEPVTVTLSDLPAGVTADETKKTIEKGQDSVKFTLKAANDAKPEKGQKVKVTAKSSDMSEGPLEFTLNVTEKKS